MHVVTVRRRKIFHFLFCDLCEVWFMWS